MNSLRVFFRGGVTSYRALFGWLNPWVAVPMFVIAPLFQLLFFAYLGRATDVASDTYFVVGNALLAASLPGIIGVGGSVSGLCTGALGLRIRDVISVAWIFQPVLLLVSGANVPRDRLPDWLQAIGSCLPLTHGIRAARDLVAGQTLAQSGTPLLLELAIGLAYAVTGVLLLRLFEFESRRTASLETM